MTRVVCFLRSIDRKSSLFAKVFLFFDDENSVTISETREYLVLVISGYLLQFSGSIWLSLRACLQICDHVYGECCQQFSIHVLIHLAVFFWIGMKGDGLLYIKVNLQVTTRYFFCLLLKKLMTYFLSSTVCIVKMVRSMIRLNTIAMFTMEGGLMFRTFAQFLFKLLFQRDRGV